MTGIREILPRLAGLRLNAGPTSSCQQAPDNEITAQSLHNLFKINNIHQFCDGFATFHCRQVSMTRPSLVISIKKDLPFCVQTPGVLNGYWLAYSEMLSSSNQI
jgi:hypothetical protein